MRALIIIVLVATFLRFFQLGQNPPSLTWDEAAWGYNAYSLGIDGRDEFGKFLPHDYLLSFGDFKPPVYAYLDILPVKVLGLNEFATRFPSALFGVLTVLVTYFLTKRIFWGSPNKEKYALLSAGMLAISPWHINLSRAAFEANVATFFIVAGVWLFLAGVRERKWYLLLSVISLVLSLYIFNTARVVAPLIGIVLAVSFYKELLERKKQIMIACLLGIFLILPSLRFLVSPQAQLRYKEVNIFSDISVIQTINQETANDHNAWWSKIIHNRRFAYGVEFVKHYFDNLSPEFIFVKGDGNPKFSTQDLGQFYLIEAPFLIAGILFLVRKREKNWWLIPLWLLIGIIPAATARETPHALRIETTLPTFQILVAYGFYHVITGMQGSVYSFKLRRILALTVIIFLSAHVLYYLHGYYSHYTREYSGQWQYGYKESIAYVQSVQDKYDQINITEELGRPYIYYLFYLQTPPSEFRKNAIIESDVFGFVTVSAFEKYHFAKDPNAIAKKGSKVLYINLPQSVPAEAEIVKKFYLLNGDVALIAYNL